MSRKATLGLVPVAGARCRCGHEWRPRKRGEKPRVCPKCKSPNWDLPKQQVRTGSRPGNDNRTSVL